MARGLIQLDLADVGSVDGLVAALDQLFANEAFEQAADHGSLGQPQHQALPDHVRIGGEQFQLLAEHAMVAALGLFDHCHVLVELGLARTRRCRKPLQLLARGVPLPIGAGDRQQLERADRAGAGNVRAAAEVDELALAIERQRGVVGQAFLNVLDLERLAQVAAQRQRLVARLFQSLERFVGLDDLGHLGLDLGKVLFRQWARELEVVVEAVVGGGAERQLHAVEQPHHGPGHHVRGRMPHHGQRLGIFLGEQPQRDAALAGQKGGGADDLAVHFRGQRGLGQARADFGRYIDRANALRVFTDRTVGQSDLEHDSPSPFVGWAAAPTARTGRHRYKGCPSPGQRFERRQAIQAQSIEPWQLRASRERTDAARWHGARLTRCIRRPDQGTVEEGAAGGVHRERGAGERICPPDQPRLPLRPATAIDSRLAHSRHR